jgi:hypothetical protein
METPWGYILYDEEARKDVGMNEIIRNAWERERKRIKK